MTTEEFRVFRDRMLREKLLAAVGPRTSRVLQKRIVSAANRFMKVPMDELWTETDTEDAVEKDYVPPRKQVERINAIHSDSEEEENQAHNRKQNNQGTPHHETSSNHPYEEDQPEMVATMDFRRGRGPPDRRKQYNRQGSCLLYTSPSPRD